MAYERNRHQTESVVETNHRHALVKQQLGRRFSSRMYQKYLNFVLFLYIFK